MSAAAPRSRLVQAAIDAAIAGIVTLGLGFPLLALRTEQDVRNDLVLQPRWSWCLAAALLVASARLASGLVDDRHRRLLAIAGAWIAAWGSFHVFLGDPAQAGAAIAGILGGLALVAATVAIDRRAAVTAIAPANQSVATPDRGNATPISSHPLLPLVGVAALALFPLVVLRLLVRAQLGFASPVHRVRRPCPPPRCPEGHPRGQACQGEQAERRWASGGR